MYLSVLRYCQFSFDICLVWWPWTFALRSADAELQTRLEWNLKRQAAEIHNEALFKQPPKPEDCPICIFFFRLPEFSSGRTYRECCGKYVCTGCSFAQHKQEIARSGQHPTCRFCRAPTPTRKDAISALRKRMEAKDGNAFYRVGKFYWHRSKEAKLGQDRAKALELLRLALNARETFLQVSTTSATMVFLIRRRECTIGSWRWWKEM